MNNQSILKLSLIMLSLLFLFSCGTTINGHKNVRVITIERDLPFPIDSVWNTIFLNYGDAHKFNPNVVNSGYIGNVKKAIVGAERFMQNDVDGNEVIHERITHFDEDKKLMRFEIFEAKNVPIDTDVTFGESQLIALDDHTTKFSIKFHYRTKPRILAIFANGSLKKDFGKMTVGIEHYLTTQEPVTKENFDTIAKLYD